ncbi:MAG TPA: hypothetical protein VF856_00040, partial [Gemmatimonadaceae bacterium]
MASLAAAPTALHFHGRQHRMMPFNRQKNVRTHNKVSLLALVVISSPCSQLRAQKLDPSLYSGLEWRMIGPF